MIDLLLINPGGVHGIYGELGNDLIALEPPPWARMIAGYIRDRGFSVEIIDAEAGGNTPLTVAVSAKICRPKLAAIVVAGHQPSASTQAMPAARAIAKAIKELNPNQKIIMVGNHPSALPHKTLKEETVDFVGVGEGPITILGLLKNQPLPGIPGLVYYDDDIYSIHQNLSAPLIENLDELHGNTWDLLPMNKYRAHQWQCFSDLSKRTPYASIYTTLGCPYSCNFCMINTIFDSNRYRRFSPEFIVNQIKMLNKNYGVETLKIADEMFILNESHYTAICKGLIESGLGKVMNLWAYARVDTVKPATLDMLRQAGFQWLALGIESGSKHVRDGADKRLKTEDIVGTVKTIQAAGINVIGNFMFGLPDDNLDTMAETIDLAFECLPEFANFYSTMAYPGSKLYDEAIQKGWALPDSWAGYSQHNRYCRPLDTQFISGADVLRFRDEAFIQYFSHQSYQNMIKRKFGQDAVDHVQKMLAYKLPRNLLEDI